MLLNKRPGLVVHADETETVSYTHLTLPTIYSVLPTIYSV